MDDASILHRDAYTDPMSAVGPKRRSTMTAQMSGVRGEAEILCSI
jgi:hypothetical protein